MDNALTQRIERGMTRVRDTPDLGKDDLSEPMRGVYDDIERTLRVPFVNFIFRTLANFPDYFVPAWKALSPHLRQVACERAGDRLRSLAANEIAVEPLAKDIMSMEDQSAVAAFADTIHYVLPKLLLTVTAFDRQASGDFIFSPMSTTGSAALIPYGIAPATGKLVLLDPYYWTRPMLIPRYARCSRTFKTSMAIPGWPAITGDWVNIRISRSSLARGTPACRHGQLSPAQAIGAYAG